MLGKKTCYNPNLVLKVNGTPDRQVQSRRRSDQEINPQIFIACLQACPSPHKAYKKYIRCFPAIKGDNHFRM